MNNMIFYWLLAVEWAGNYDNYNEVTAGVIGASLLGLGQGIKFYRWKKYRITKNVRIRIEIKSS
ncbi:MAG: hypothetical protein O6939_01280 [Bacteroidetes bacterium]|nr:hypothetical protein [Bacteroidota bacterium]